jgi:hypothetical protein
MGQEWELGNSTQNSQSKISRSNNFKVRPSDCSSSLCSKCSAFSNDDREDSQRAKSHLLIAFRLTLSSLHSTGITPLARGPASVGR